MGRNAARNVNGNNDRVRNSREPCTKENWTCKSCKVNKDGKQVPYTNFGFRTECNSCGLSKGVCFGGRCSSDYPSRSVNGAGGRLSARTGDGKRGDETPSFAEKQLRKELEAKLAKANAATSFYRDLVSELDTNLGILECTNPESNEGLFPLFDGSELGNCINPDCEYMTLYSDCRCIQI